MGSCGEVGGQGPAHKAGGVQGAGVVQAVSPGALTKGCRPAGDIEHVGLSWGLDVLGRSQQLPMLSWLFSVVRRRGRTAEGETAPETLTIGYHHPQSFTHPVGGEGGATSFQKTGLES